MERPVYLVRHGQSEWNVLRLTQGQTHHPRLTELGRRQARAAAETIADDLGGRRVARIVTSDLVRAAETAEIVAARLGGPVLRDVRLREQHLGDLQGRGYRETWAAAEAMDFSDPGVPVAGGESPRDVHRRMAGVLRDLDDVSLDAAGPAGGAVVLVSHGDAIRAAVACLNGVEPHRADWVEVRNGAVARVCEGLTWLTP